MSGLSLELLSSVLVAGLAGSLHCVGMCGGFAAVAAGAAGPATVPPSAGGARKRLAWWRSVLPLGAYQLGRLLAYVGVGVAAGVFGSGVELAGRAAGLADIAVILAGVTLLLLGAASFARLFGLRDVLARRAGSEERLLELRADPARRSRGGARGPRFERLSLLLARIHLAWARRPPLRRAFVLGAVTSLLPCGFLWAFAVVAAGTASGMAGALVMATFWLGTVPALTGVGALARTVLAPLRARLPLLAPALLVALGLAVLVWRAQLAIPLPAEPPANATYAAGAVSPAASPVVPAQPSCH